MKFNNVIDTLRLFCRNMSAAYAEDYERRGGKCFFRYLVMDEIHWKLCTLVDREFFDFAAFLAAVKGLLSDHPDPRVQNPSAGAENFILEAESAFRKCLESIRPDCSAPEIPYLRNLTGEEDVQIAARFREAWGYVPQKYWYPMTGE